jgi:hypothetical protein
MGDMSVDNTESSFYFPEFDPPDTIGLAYMLSLTGFFLEKQLVYSLLPEVFYDPRSS